MSGAYSAVSGKVWSFGQNGYKQVGLNQAGTVKNFQQINLPGTMRLIVFHSVSHSVNGAIATIATGYHHSLALTGINSMKIKSVLICRRWQAHLMGRPIARPARHRSEAELHAANRAEQPAAILESVSGAGRHRLGRHRGGGDRRREYLAWRQQGRHY